MSSVNKCLIIGNLGQDPEVRTFQDGGKVCNLSVATSERWTDKSSGEKRERTEWHRVTIRGDGLVRVAEQYLRKGSKVYIEGKLQTRKWQDQSGNDRYSTEIVVAGIGGQLVMLDGAKGQQGDSGGHDQSQGHAHGAPGGGYADIDDEIPFAPEWRI